MKTQSLIATFAFTLVITHAAASPNVGFRDDGTGHYPKAAPVTTWQDAEGDKAAVNITWKTKLPSWSNASPVPVGDAIFVCAEPFTLICLDAKTGAIRWQATNDYATVKSFAARREAKAGKPDDGNLNEDLDGIMGDDDTAMNMDESGDELRAMTAELKPKAPPPQEKLPPKHGSAGYSSSTPVSDGKHVWAFFGNGVAAGYTVSGERLWIKEIERPTHGHGHSASPCLVGDLLIVPVINVHALDARTGEERWQARSGARFGSPVVTRIAGTTCLVTANGEIIETDTGRVVTTGMKGLTYNGPVVADGIAVFFNQGAATAYRLPTSLQGEPKAEQIWKAVVPDERMYASPLVTDGRVYCLGQNGTLTAIDLESGEIAYKEKAGTSGTCYSSISTAGDQMIMASEGGSVIFVNPGDSLDVTARNTIETLRSTPVFHGKRLYLRTKNFLYCIAADK